VRVLHTADWHLGQTLHGVSRAHEHARFLAWLIEAIISEDVDALIIAGDVFDQASPGPVAQQAYYGFLAELRRRCPEVSIAVIGGNHDSPQRLDAPKALLSAVDIAVVGGLPRRPDDTIDLDRVIIPLATRGGSIGALLVAVPFLRPGDLPPVDSPQDLSSAYRALYRELVDAAHERRQKGQALMATGHCYMAGGLVSELSERKIQVGNQYALSADVFPGELAYVALGHLHRAQTAESRQNVRYSGSPIPLSFAERTYEHQVLIVDLEGDRLSRVHSLRVPRAVELLSIPEEHAPVSTVLELLGRLPGRESMPQGEETWPMLEVRVLLESAAPRLRRDIEDAIEGKAVRLLRIDARFADGSHESTRPHEQLQSIGPERVFMAAYVRERGREPDPDLIALFRELVAEVEDRQGGGA
jgi:exonuclease SbcD